MRNALTLRDRIAKAPPLYRPAAGIVSWVMCIGIASGQAVVGCVTAVIQSLPIRGSFNR
jgi:hypothetical protein